ncbi:MAG TPA: DUF58 domain-containing protein [Gemmatimonadaceae bacterium]|nr:DUF58 domain-containing protein [Gemmatimonadaceae bacterium]
MSVDGSAHTLAVSARPRIRFAPTRRLALAVAAAALLWVLPGGAGTFAAEGALALVALLTALDAALLPARTALALVRTFPDTVGLGDTAAGSYTITSLWPRAFEIELRDRFAPLVSGGAGTTTASLPPGAARELAVDATGVTRGRAALGPVGVRAHTRLGLVSARFLFEGGDTLLVVPSLSGVRRFRLLAMQHRLETAGVRTLRRRGEGLSFANLREYAIGDDPRRIDWKATARRAQLITREYTVERSQTVITLVDAGRSMTQLAQDRSRFEHALSSALILTDIAANAGDRVGALVFDDEVRAWIQPRPGRAALHAIRDAFIPLAATTREPDYAAAFRFLAAHQRKRALIVFITDVIDPRASQALIAHVSRSAARHLAVVVALRNDAIFAAALPRAVGGPDRLYESAAAEELIMAREAALQGMRRAGVSVLDVSPHAMTANVVNRYLELKSRGAL